MATVTSDMMTPRNLKIAAVAAVILPALIAWTSRWFRSEAPKVVTAPVTTTEQPAGTTAPATTTPPAATTTAPATAPAKTTTL